MEAALQKRSKRHLGSGSADRATSRIGGGRFTAFFAAAVVALAIAACGGAASSNAPANAPNDAPGASAEPSPGTTASSDAPAENAAPRDVAQIHKAKCGACHLRVEPGLRTRAELESAFKRHRKRVKMSEPEWQAMIDYLAAPQ